MSCPRNFSWPVRVYYEDTDAGGVVYYANYLGFMERARTEWLRHLGFEQPVLAEQFGVLFVVRAVNIEYLMPGRFNDSLRVDVTVMETGGSLLRFAQQVCRGSDVLASAQVDVVCVAVASFRPQRIPASLRTAIESVTDNHNDGAGI